ncbi:chymotrypsin-2 [Drosophila navojoa]|nr:chymotrypsin-2 [Drosophila navojoa]
MELTGADRSVCSWPSIMTQYKLWLLPLSFLVVLLLPRSVDPIVGGQNAAAGDAPYQISLQTLAGSHLCGGAIISASWILTAGHCVSGWPADRLRVAMGSTRYSEPGAVHYPAAIYLHCSYDRPKYHSDIALLQLNESIAFDALTQPVQLVNESWPAGSLELLFTGWGTQSAGGATPAQLQRVQQQHIPRPECEARLDGYEDVQLGGCHVCAFRERNIGACHGDTGGPLVYKDQLVGILNFMVPCAQGVPDVFMDLRYYSEWIRRTISGNGRCAGVQEQTIN